MHDGFAPGLQLIHGNRMEDLGDLLLAQLKRAPLRPLEPAVFLVQSNGMAQWLKLRLARPDGWHVSAAVDMQMPARFVWQAYRAVLGSDAVPERGPLDKPWLVWRLMRLLPLCLATGEPAYAPLERYLRDDRDLRKRYQLAVQLADIYDQYQVYRADWLSAWSAGTDHLSDARGEARALPAEQRWQALLWRALLDDVGESAGASRAQLQQRFAEALTNGSGPLAALPRRLIVFGVSSLPQQWLEALAALSTRLQVQVYVHNPCRYYWADIIEARDLLRRGDATRRKPGLEALEGAALHAQVNPLLAAWGRQGRDYMALLDRYDEGGTKGRVDLFLDWAEATSPSLLAQVQQGILDLDPAPSPPRPVHTTDDSLVFHVAHSRQREVEILHDRLLDLFSRPGPAGTAPPGPRDVIVMVPDIDAYAPHIEAVFGNLERDDPRYVPYTIADRPARAASPMLAALERLLRLPDARFATSEILALLAVAGVRRRFGFDESAIALLSHWIQASGIRWGLDAQQRESLDLPGACHQNSWRFGLDRMLLGYATGGAGPWRDIEPFAEPSGHAAGWIGHLDKFIESLDRHRRRLATLHTPAAWGALVRELVGAFLLPETAEEELLLERFDETLEHWLAACEAGGLIEPLPLPVVRDALLSDFDEQNVSQRFLAGCVNFATLMPMRAIPFPVVCLLGMNDGDYPRQRQPADFDLMAAHYRPGDRSRREDDRYLFLEALLSARRQLYISYVGRDQRDNSRRTPSVLVGQLRDHLEIGWQLAAEDPAAARSLLEHLTVEHPLQPFSHRYFEGADDGRLFTYAREWQPTRQGFARAEGSSLRAEGSLLHPEGASIKQAELPPPAPDSELITVAELANFLRRPADHFFARRLGITLVRDIETIADDEPFDLDALERHQARLSLVDSGRRALDRAAGLDDRRAAAEAMNATVGGLQRSGLLPPGAGGELQAAALLADSSTTLDHWRTALGRWRERAEPLEIDLSLASDDADENAVLRIQDWLGDVRSDGNGGLALVECRPSQAYAGPRRYKFHYFTGLWTRYLAARACGYDVAGLLVSSDGLHRLPRVDGELARDCLNSLAGAWHMGLRRPLPAPLATSMCWLAGDAADVAEPEMRRALANVYEGGQRARAERDDSPALRRCWPDLDSLLADDFPSWAARLFEPLHAALQAMEHAP